MCVCSLNYPACNAHAPYCHLWPVWLYQTFSHYLIDRGIFWGAGIIKCVFWFTLQILSEMFIILRRNERDFIINVHRSSRGVPDILVRLQRNLNFLNRVLKISQISNYTKIRPVEVELFHGQT